MRGVTARKAERLAPETSLYNHVESEVGANGMSTPRRSAIRAPNADMIQAAPVLASYVRLLRICNRSHPTLASYTGEIPRRWRCL